MEQGEKSEQVRGLIEDCAPSAIKVEDQGKKGFKMFRVFDDPQIESEIVAKTKGLDHVVIYSEDRYRMDVGLVKNACETAKCDYTVRF